MTTIQHTTIQEAWLDLLFTLVHDHDHRTAPRGQTTREIIGVTVRFDDLRSNIIYHPARNLNYRFLVAEFLWVALGLEDVKTLTNYNSQMSRFSDDGEKLAGAYGPRLQPQWPYIFETLRRDPDSRQAVATIWTPGPSPSRDVPCTVAIQFLVRDGKLNALVTMRSSDIWLGLPYDAYTFAQLANCVAGTLGLETGYLQFNLGSSHLYESDLARAEQVLGDVASYQGLRSPILPGFPPDLIKYVLQNPDDLRQPVLDCPWERYANVLRAESWKDAFNLLDE